MDKIGILFFIDTLYGPSGAERNLIQVASNINKSRFNPVICCLKAGEFINELKDNGMKIINLNINKIYGLGAVLKLLYVYKIIKKEKIKIIVSYHEASDYYGLLAGKLFGVPVIISNRRDMGYNLKKRHILIYRIINKFYTKIITVCNELRNTIIDRENTDATKIITIYNGVGDNMIFECNGFVTRKELNLATHKLTVAKIANLRTIKGYKYFIETAALVKRELPDVQFLIVGYDLKEPEASIEYLSDYAKELGVLDNIIFTGFKKNISEITKIADVLVSSSLSEGCSNVILESMRWSKPVIATSVGGNPELIEDGVNGYLVKPKDSKAMANALLKVLKDIGLAKKLGENGRKIYLENFTEERMIKNLENLFGSLLEETIKVEKTNNKKDINSDYSWVLCPLLSLSEAFSVLNKEINGMEERLCTTKEDILNIYLLLSAVNQVVSDFMIRGFYDFSKLTEGFTFLTPIVKFFYRINQYFIWLRNVIFERNLQQFLKDTEQTQANLVKCLIELYHKNTDVNLSNSVLKQIKKLTKTKLPPSLKICRLKLPSAFRSFALTHIDFFRLGDKFISAHSEESLSIKVLGLRSTGSYLAPILAEYLRNVKGYRVSFITVRAKSALSFWEWRRLNKLVKTKDKILITDDPPTTGATLRLCIDKLINKGINKNRIALLIPEYPYQNGWSTVSLQEPFSSIELFRLPYYEWYVNELLRPENVTQALEPYFKNNGYSSMEVNDFTPSVLAINKEFSHKKRMGEREKRVFEVISKNGAQSTVTYVFAKSVGWGWFGYHALIIAKRLEKFVPKVFTLKDGILYMKWIMPEQDMDKDCPSIENIAEYVSERTRNLCLKSNPSVELMDRNIGLAEIANIISGIYSRKLGKLRRFNILRKLIEGISCDKPSLTDSKMGNEKWIRNLQHYSKIDFEEHGFDNSDLSVVDPAYDLASAIYEFGFKEKEEVNLVKHYTESSGDNNLTERLFLYKILYSYNKLYESAVKISSLEDPLEKSKLDKLYWKAFLFLIKTTHNYFANALDVNKSPVLTDNLFVVDIDGIFDDYALVFPSPTPMGIMALKLLKDNGYSIIFNSGRSLEEIKDYCACYGAIGGIAEYGAVAWDNINSKAKILLPEKEIDELQKIKESFSKRNHFLISPLHDYSLRVYTYKKLEHIKIDKEIMQEILSGNKLNNFLQVDRVGRNELVSTSVNKGTGLKALIDSMGFKPKKIVSIGDSDSDIAMFKYSNVSFTPQNHSRKIDELAKEGKVKIVNGISQRGLFNAVKLLLDSYTGSYRKKPSKCNTDNDGVVMKLFSIKDRPKWLRMLMFLHPDTLRVFRL